MPRKSHRRSHRKSVRRVSRKRSSRGKHLYKYAKKMSYLAAKYRNGEYGNMQWKDVIRKYMKSPVQHHGHH